jgi:hypothetical protein
MAQIRAANPLHRGKERIKVTLNGVTRTYDIKNNKFVTAENSPFKTTPSSTPSIASTAEASAPLTSELN